MSKFYEVLGVTDGVDPGQVKSAFHTLAKSSHPDVNAAYVTAEGRFKDINEAYQILSDPERRAAYDLGLKHKHLEMNRRVRNAIVATHHATCRGRKGDKRCSCNIRSLAAGRRHSWRILPAWWFSTWPWNLLGSSMMRRLAPSRAVEWAKGWSTCWRPSGRQT
jgi:DnaJ domain